MQPVRSRPLSVTAVAFFAFTALTVLAAPGTSYAVERPHAHDDAVAHTAAVPTSTVFPTSGLPVGDEPAIPYAFASDPGFGDGDWQLRRPDGSTLRLPRLSWSAWAPMGSGAIGMAGTEAGPELQRVAGDGGVHARMVSHFGLAVSPDDRIVGWLGDHGAPHLVEAEDARGLTLPRVPGGRTIGAIWGITTCQEQEPEGGGCAAFVDAGHGPGRRVWAASSHGTVTGVHGMLQVSDVNGSGRLAGLVSRRTPERRACWGVFRGNGHLVFRTCRYYLDAFSPNGHRILAERSQSRWSSVRRFAVLGRDGHLVRAWTFDPNSHRSLAQLTWEDDHHLLGVLQAHGRWALVRIGTDGLVEYAGAPVATTDDGLSPYNLPMH